MRHFEDVLENRKYLNVHAAAYGWALALSLSGQTDQARLVLDELAEAYPRVVSFRAELAKNELRANNLEAALRAYADGYNLFPDNKILVRGYALALLRAQQGDKALKLIEDYARLHGMDAPLLRLISEAQAQTGDVIASQLSLAEHYYQNGQLVPAIQQLRIASRNPDKDYYYGARIDARLQEFQHEREQRAHP